MPVYSQDSHAIGSCDRMLLGCDGGDRGRILVPLRAALCFLLGEDAKSRDLLLFEINCANIDAEEVVQGTVPCTTL